MIRCIARDPVDEYGLSFVVELSKSDNQNLPVIIDWCRNILGFEVFPPGDFNCDGSWDYFHGLNEDNETIHYWKFKFEKDAILFCLRWK